MCMKSAQSVTASDVARLAGVDRSTVSRILNRSFDQHHYAPETIDAVQKAAKSLNYRPSSTARALRTGRTMLAGLIVADISNSFFGQLAAAIEVGLRSHNYRLMIASTSEDLATQCRHLDDMIHQGVDGIIISPAGNKGIAHAVSSGTPVVLVDRPLSGVSWPYVGIDNHNAARQLGEYLRELGYQTIGVVLPQSKDDPTLKWRLRGLEIGLGKRGRVVWKHAVSLRTGEADRRALSQRLSQSPNLDVVVGLTNDCTVTAMEALRDAGRRVPDEIGLAGVDDFRAAQLLDPPLTVVSQPIESIAAKAVSYLLDAMSGHPRTEDCLLPSQLIVRRSLRLPNGNTDHLDNFGSIGNKETSR